MVQTYYIIFTLRTPGGFEPYGRFFIGNNRQKAQQLFEKMRGNSKATSAHVLHVELVETANDLPVNLRMLDCTLEDIEYNCRTITKELFKWYNLIDL
jgi:hypothetical protein